MRALLVAALIVAPTLASAQTQSSLDNMNAQARVPSCATGQVYDPNARACIVPTATQDLTGFYIGGALIAAGVIGAIVLANNGDKTASP